MSADKKTKVDAPKATKTDKRKSPKRHAERSTETPSDGTLEISIFEARHLAGMDRGGTSDPYCVVKSTFNKQQFKTKIVKKTVAPVWNQTFKFYTKKLQGHVFVKVWDKDRWTSDDFLGEVAIPIKQLSNGEPLEDWFPLQNEPKKQRNKEKNNQAGEVKIRLHYPGAKKKKKKSKQDKEEPKAVKDKAKKNIRDVYTFGKELGKGGFSVVREGIHKETGDKVAIKIIEKQNAGEEELQLLQREIDIMEKLHHKNIIALIETYDEPDYIYLVLELVSGGELFDQIVSRGNYGEPDAAQIVKQILEAIQYMHSNGVAHRDLKPENLLCGGKNGEVIKVTDFGLSKDFGQEQLKTSCGTPDYVAPEVLIGKAYDNSVDIWSIGVITYILLCGFPPFYGDNDQQIFEKIMKADFNFPSPDWDAISKEAKDFVTNIFVLDVHKRPSAAQCLEHPWVANNTANSEKQSLTRLESFRDQMKEYNQKRAKGR